MPFIPHTNDDIEAMLDSIGVRSNNDLFDEIPPILQAAALEHTPEGIDEQALTRLMHERQAQHQPGRCFIGAGAYEHYIPAAVWELVRRGEFYTAYTPYQAEASQGSLQLIYEFQSAMTELMAMEVSNASLYDGASALAEATLMAVRIQRSKKNQILVPENLHPSYRKVLETLLKHQPIELINIPYDARTGTIDIHFCKQQLSNKTAALIIAQPNFFGTIEMVDELVSMAHQQQALVIAQVNPVAMALLQPPGQWGEKGADIACGEGQPLGVPLSIGGPYFGFLCTRLSHVRQMPGRLVGRTIDRHDAPCYTLTLQAREQHIRRSKATSNICTNQGLLVAAATIFMRLMGAKGLLNMANTSHNNALELQQRLCKINGVTPIFEQPFFNEFGIRLNKHKSQQVLNDLRKNGLQGGYDLSQSHPQLGDNTLLICATETKTTNDLQHYQQALATLLQQETR